MLLIGESNAGKSSQIRRFANDTFSNAYCSTIGVDFSVRTLTFGERTVKLQVWDTSGQERFRSITSSYYRGAHAVMIVYAGNDRRSFEGVPRWLEEVTQHMRHTDTPDAYPTRTDTRATRRLTATVWKGRCG